MAVTTVAGFAAAQVSAPRDAQAATGGWVGSWATAPMAGSASASGTKAHDGFAGKWTLRQDVQLSVGGEQLRIRLSNRYGTQPITFGSVSVARPDSGGDPIYGTIVRATFSGQNSVTVAPGQDVASDAVAFSAPSQSQIVVSTYLPTATGPTTWHHIVKGRSSAGKGSKAFTNDRLGTQGGSYFLTGVDVLRGEADRGTVVALGDSITDGVLKDKSERYSYGSIEPWSDRLSRRILWNNGKIRGTVNEGIAGNQLLAGGASMASGSERLGTDALSTPSVTTVVMLLGTNDVIKRATKGVTGDALYDGAREMANRAHAQGVTLVGSTVPPIGASSATPTGRTREAVRTAYNNRIRSSSPFDCTVDFDAVLRDPSSPNHLAPQYDSGDHLHPNAAGYRAMGEAVPTSCIR